MAVVTISTMKGQVRRVPRNKHPTVELNLEDFERVVQFELTSHEYFHIDRKTVDWTWVATIERRHPEAR